MRHVPDVLTVFLTLFFIGLAVLSIAGCTDVQRAYVDQAIEQKKEYSDTEAQVFKSALCAMTVGAYYRINSQDERNAIETLCNPAGRPSDFDDLVKAAEAIKVLRAVE